MEGIPCWALSVFFKPAPSGEFPSSDGQRHSVACPVATGGVDLFASGQSFRLKTTQSSCLELIQPTAVCPTFAQGFLVDP